MVPAKGTTNSFTWSGKAKDHVELAKITLTTTVGGAKLNVQD